MLLSGRTGKIACPLAGSIFYSCGQRARLKIETWFLIPQILYGKLPCNSYETKSSEQSRGAEKKIVTLQSRLAIIWNCANYLNYVFKVKK